eukprot:jgi/Picsp_1/2650/NSC_00880-R1_zinc finger ccch domain-containing protein
MKKNRYRWTRNNSNSGQLSANAIPGRLEVSDSNKAPDKLVRDSKPQTEFRVSRFSLVRGSNYVANKGKNRRCLTWHRPKSEEEVAQSKVVSKPPAEQRTQGLKTGQPVHFVTSSSRTARGGRNKTWVRVTGTPVSAKKTPGKVMGKSVGSAVSSSRWISWEHRNRKKASMVWKNPHAKRDSILLRCPKSDSLQKSAELTPELGRGKIGEKSPIIRASVARTAVRIQGEQSRKSLERSPKIVKIQSRSPRVKQSKGRRVLKILDIGGKIYQSTSKPGSKSLNLNPSVPQQLPQVKEVTENTLKMREKSDVKELRRMRSQGKQARVQVSNPRTSMLQKVRYCPIYCHTGICPKRKKGCKFAHDPTKRAVCTKWLTGVCQKGLKCPLQHQMKRELMPACVHYLQGKCKKVDCPWLHQNIDKEAPVCQAFIRGYCPAGESCAFKHYTIKQVKEEKRLRLPVPNEERHIAREGQMKLSKRKRYFENPSVDFGSTTDATPTEAEPAMEILKKDSLAQGNSIPDYIDL